MLALGLLCMKSVLLGVCVLVDFVCVCLNGMQWIYIVTELA